MILACPQCDGSSDQSNRNARRRLCGYVFPISKGIVREAHSRKKKGPEKKEKYVGKKAGTITIPQFRWGSTRISW